MYFDQFTSLIILNQSLYLTCTLFILGPFFHDVDGVIVLIDLDVHEGCFIVGIPEVEAEVRWQVHHSLSAKTAFTEVRKDQFIQRGKLAQRIDFIVSRISLFQVLNRPDVVRIEEVIILVCRLMNGYPFRIDFSFRSEPLFVRPIQL